jgi:hypothetical protein
MTEPIGPPTPASAYSAQSKLTLFEKNVHFVATVDLS